MVSFRDSSTDFTLVFSWEERSMDFLEVFLQKYFPRFIHGLFFCDSLGIHPEIPFSVPAELNTEVSLEILYQDCSTEFTWDFPRHSFWNFTGDSSGIQSGFLQGFLLGCLRGILPWFLPEGRQLCLSRNPPTNLYRINFSKFAQRIISLPPAATPRISPGIS